MLKVLLPAFSFSRSARVKVIVRLTSKKNFDKIGKQKERFMELPQVRKKGSVCGGGRGGQRAALVLNNCTACAIRMPNLRLQDYIQLLKALS